jgi:hypothetical protein
MMRRGLMGTWRKLHNEEVRNFQPSYGGFTERKVELADSCSARALK